VCQNGAKKDRKLYKRQWIKDDSRKYKKCANVVCGRPSYAWETNATCQVFVQLDINTLVYIKQGSWGSANVPQPTLTVVCTQITTY
jgi:hypothetical protein